MNRAERAYNDRVADLGCCICGAPAEIHHAICGRFSQVRASHFDTIPLCHWHHRTGGHGEAIHAGKKTWQERHGSEADFLADTKRKLVGTVVPREE